ncbi:WecB/TagA/CpsF family glycosyltransferase [Butyrivibrio fibrisolvens]|uniref:WecB/TagA/CpsF family glycosyltransferase n=1 Tax=Butyrivibrio fibrisolvens TaxID=831 RepID=UPI0004045281|nr:WecB/TagA/CpsF family glycosyltransferase [Butyrivibrio fibrisolvens]
MSGEVNIPTCNIMGVNVAAINMDILIGIISEKYRDLSGKYICVANVHTTVMASENEYYRKIQNESYMVIPDGGPLSSYGRKKGFKKMRRTFGPDFMEETIKRVEGARHFFYGSTNEILEKMQSNFRAKYPTVNIVGAYSPPFRELTKKEDSEIIELINKKHPDFVWVGLGAPKQEIWMYEHQNEIEGLMVGIGAGFAYHAGVLKRAPVWMQKRNLEWLYRLIQEPKRLFKRYYVTNIKFLKYILFQRVK